MADKSLNIKITGNSDNAKKAVKDLDKETQGLNKTVDTLKAAFVGLATIQTVKMAYSMAESAAANERIATTFDNAAKRYGIDSKAMMTALDNVTKKTIDDDEIMAKVNQTMSTGVITNQEDIVRIMEIARRKGKEMGIDTLTAYDTITGAVEGLRTASLIKMGVQVDEMKLYDDYAKTLGISSDELTDQQKQQILLGEIVGPVSEGIRAQGEDVVDSKDKFDQLKRKMGDVQDEIGNALLPAFEGIFNFLEKDFIPAIDKTFQFFKDNEWAVTLLAGALTGVLMTAIAASAPALATLLGTLVAIGTTFTVGIALAGSFWIAYEATEQLIKWMEQLENNREADTGPEPTTWRKNIGRTIVNVPGFAGGVENFSGGMALVGENGPELVNLPSGSDVIPNDAMGGVTVNINSPHVNDESDLRRIADYVTKALVHTRDLSMRGAAL